MQNPTNLTQKIPGNAIHLLLALAMITVVVNIVRGA
jgi:hypothetical protein